MEFWFECILNKKKFNDSDMRVIEVTKIHIRLKKEGFVADWLLRLTRNQVVSGKVGSNPIPDIHRYA